LKYWRRFRRPAYDPSLQLLSREAWSTGAIPSVFKPTTPMWAVLRPVRTVFVILSQTYFIA
jgi:hypothetical protein